MEKEEHRIALPEVPAYICICLSLYLSDESAHSSYLCSFRSMEPLIIHIASLYFCIAEKLYIFKKYLKLFPIALRAVLKVPVFTILLRHSHTLNSWTHAVSNYHEVINVNREDIPGKEGILHC